MTDFSAIVSDEDSQVEGGAQGGSFVVPLAVAGTALLRLQDVIEFGTINSEYKGTPKKKRPVTLTFQLVHPRHAINKKAEGDDENGPFTGDFVRHQTISVRLNKSNSEKSAYMKIFNKMNYDGAVSTAGNIIPSFVNFAGKGFLGEVHHNPSKTDPTKIYVNLDKGGEYSIGAPQLPEVDELGAPTGNFRAVTIPEMEGSQRVFLFDPSDSVSDDTLRLMWDSIAIVGQKADGTPYKNWIQEAILCRETKGNDNENIALPGSRTERLFGTSTEEAALDDLIAETTTVPADELLGKPVVAEETASVPSATPSPSEPEVIVDPLAGL